MAAQSNTVTTGASLNRWWRKVQGPVADKAFAHGKAPERQFYQSLSAWGTPSSAYEVTFPIDTNERGGVASITDGGHMAKPSSVNAVEAQVNVVHFNKRFAVSDLTRFTDAGQQNQLKRQIVAQAAQAGDAMQEHFADYLHGGKAAILALTDTDISGTTATLTLKNGYNNSTITNAKYLASMWKVGDRGVALDGSNALISGVNSFFEVTSVSKTNGTIGVTFDGSVTYSTNDIRLVKANNLEGTTAAGGSDLNKGIEGFQDLLFATTFHNVSGSTNPNWTVALNVSAAGRFTPSQLKRAKQEIANDSGYEADTVLVAQGVYRDMMNQQLAGLRFEDANTMSFDGDVQAKGMKFLSTKRVPPGYVAVGARASLRKWEAYSSSASASYGDLQPSETLAGGYGRLDWVGNLICESRKAWAVFTSQTEA